MRVDVVNLAPRASRLLQRATCGAHGAVPARGWEGDVLRVRRCTVANDLGERRGAARKGEIESFKKKNAGTFGHHEAVARAVERSRCCGRIATRRATPTSRKRTHIVESGDHHRVQRRLGAASECSLRITATDRLVRFANGVTCGGAGADRTKRWTLRIDVDRNLARRHVADRSRNQEW